MQMLIVRETLDLNVGATSVQNHDCAVVRQGSPFKKATSIVTKWSV
jgi:hypothetical protein